MNFSVKDWRTPADLATANFVDDERQIAQDSATKSPEPQPPPQQTSMLDKLLPLIGKINNGGLDITTVLDLLDKSGQGFGALGKLLPVLAPLLQNFAKKPKHEQTKTDTREDIIEYDTVNLD